MITGASGAQIPDHIYLKSFKLYDTSIFSGNEHFKEARRKKADYEGLAKDMKAHAKDLLYNRSLKEAR